MTSDTAQPALEPAIFIIFGITGDLSRRKLLPALYRLVQNELVHEHTAIIGITRREVDIDEVLKQTEVCIQELDGACDSKVLEKLRSMMQMVQMDLTDAHAYDALCTKLDALEEEHGLCMNRLFYLSIPPQVYGSITRLLGRAGLNLSCTHGTAASRLLIEKPFGYDIASATELIETIRQIFTEDQVYRIDHYIAKETVQNVVAFRMHNPIFSNLWNGKYIRTIQITATEDIDIEGRATFYEEVGALRDFIQSHLLQLLALVIMDLPTERTPEALHSARLAALGNVSPLQPTEVDTQTVRAQYEGYFQEVHNDHSTTETFAAMLLRLNGERWRDVPVVIKTGKALNEKRTEIVIVFETDTSPEARNVLRFRIQPDEGIGLTIEAKRPGYAYQTEQVTMDFSYRQAFGQSVHPDAYERVLVDAVRGDRTLFTTSEEVLAAWRIVEPAIQVWCSPSSKPFLHYAKGSAGPPEADMLADKSGYAWL